MSFVNIITLLLFVSLFSSYSIIDLERIVTIATVPRINKNTDRNEDTQSKMNQSKDEKQSKEITTVILYRWKWRLQCYKPDC